MVFYGEYQVAFTGVGRIVLPKKIRELLKGNTFIITKGFDQCLAGYDRQDWENRAQSLLAVSLLEKEQMEKRRFLFSSTVYLEIDDQGRFVLPKHLLNYAKLASQALVCGVGDHFEIWEPKVWQEYIKSTSS